MAQDRLIIHERPNMQAPRMILGFAGWMDGGGVSTGTIECLRRKLHARLLAEMDCEDLYILSFPGSMEISAMFRPHTKIEDGLITTFRGPRNRFFYSGAHNLILFAGREPNLKWSEFGGCIFSLASQFNVSMIYFIGSVAGLVPHTRQPRLSASVSDESLKPTLEAAGVRFSNYEGPASVVTYLTRLAAKRQIPMASLVAEIPAYVQGRNHRCIEAVTRRIARILNIQIDLDDLRKLGDRLEERLDEVLQGHGELLERIHQLEENYDNDVFDTQMGDLKEWLEQQGIRLD